MPRVMELSDELEVLTKALQEDPKLLRQYVLRLPVAYAIEFIQDCIQKHKQPAHLLRDIVECHYDDLECEKITIKVYQTNIINLLHKETGQSPEEIVNNLIDQFGPTKLAEIRRAKRPPESNT